MNLDDIALIVAWGIFALWAVLLVPSACVMLPRTLARMTDRLPRPATWPLVSMIIPARDEGEKIDAALRSVLAIDYPNLEILAVDDRSRDETGRVMDRLAAEDARLRVIHVETLPDGWLGKNHAMHVAAQAARGEFLLFTDGDVLFAADALHRAVAYAEHTRIDHLCLSPNLVPGSYFENALVAYFILLFTAGLQPWLVPSRLRFVYAGVGAFNMLRHSAYRAIGGHVPIRLDVLDDVKLGKLVKRHGLRQDLLGAQDRVRVRWQASAWGVIRGLEKNGFASCDYSLPLLLLVSVLTLTVTLGPYLGACLLSGAPALGGFATIVLLHVMYGALAH